MRAAIDFIWSRAWSSVTPGLSLANEIIQW